MAKEFSKAFYKSRTWQRVRQFIWKRDNGLCQDCLKKGLITPGKEDNLITLCKSCHEARHNASARSRRYSVKADGSVEILPLCYAKIEGHEDRGDDSKI